MSGSVGETEDPEVNLLLVEIEETRSEMSETVDAIQDRLSPDTLADQAKDKLSEVTEQAIQEAKVHAIEAVKDVAEQAKEQAREAIRDISHQAGQTVREATIGRVEHAVMSVEDTARGVQMTMMETIKQNPMPAAIAAISLGWLFMKRSKSTTGYTSAYPNGVSGTARGYQPIYPRPESQGLYQRDGDQGVVGKIASNVSETADHTREGEPARQQRR